MKVISRQRAKNRGLIHYFTGEPCVRGHLAPRTVSSCTCTECKSENWQEEKRRNHESLSSNRGKGRCRKVSQSDADNPPSAIEVAKTFLTRKW